MVGAAQGIHARQHIVSRGSGVRARHYTPPGAVPVLDKRTVTPAYLRVADRPNVVARQGVHPVQRICPSSDVRSGNLGPATAVPMLGPVLMACVKSFVLPTTHMSLLAMVAIAEAYGGARYSLACSRKAHKRGRLRPLQTPTARGSPPGVPPMAPIL